MKATFSQFHPDRFSFADDPVLVLEDFWSPEERKVVREAMAQAKWIALADMPPVAQAFPNCGNWLKAEIAPSEAAYFIQRVGMSCVAAYVESFPK